jgi:fructokinase
MQVVTLGEILIDMFPAEVGRRLVDVSAFHPKPGGAPANVAVAASRLGAPSAFMGKVGDDIFGRHLVDVLREQGVETRAMRVSTTARTTMAIIAMPDPDTAEFIFYRNPGADLLLQPDELDEDLLAEAQALHIGSLSLVDEPARSATHEAVRQAQAAGALVSFDVNYRPSLWSDAQAALEQIWHIVPQVDLLKVNEDELALLSVEQEAGAEAAKALLDAGPDLIVVTRGSRGSEAYTRTVHVEVPGFAVETVDAIGCGDAFIAALLTELTAVVSWPEALDPDALRAVLCYANAVGALTAQTQGVIPALPTAVEVEQFLADRSPNLSLLR